jgi:hypothetical protein
MNLSKKLMTPLPMNLDGNKKVLAIHIYGDEKIRLWKRCEMVMMRFMILMEIEVVYIWKYILQFGYNYMNLGDLKITRI